MLPSQQTFLVQSGVTECPQRMVRRKRATRRREEWGVRRDLLLADGALVNKDRHRTVSTLIIGEG